MPLRLRFFTPEVEENVCGHGTVAALVHLARQNGLSTIASGFPVGRFPLEMNVGVRFAEVRDGVAWLEYEPAQAWEIEVSREAVALAAGLETDDLHEDLPVLAATAGRAKLFAAVPSTTILDAAEPDLERVKALNLETDTTGLVLFTFPGRGGAFTDSRHFAPLAGIPEDIATGNAHAALAAYLARTGFLDDGERSFSGAQGHALGRPSRLEVRATVSGGEVVSVAVGGRAVEVNG